MSSMFDCIRCGLQLNEDQLQHTGCCGKVICRACVESLLVSQNEGIFERIFDCQNCVFDVKNNRMRKNVYLGHLINLVSTSKNIPNSSILKTAEESTEVSQLDTQNLSFQVKISCGRCNAENIQTVCICQTCNRGSNSSNNSMQNQNKVQFTNYSQLGNLNQSQYLCEDCCNTIHSVGDYLKHQIQRIPVNYFLQKVVNKQKLFEAKSSNNSLTENALFNHSGINHLQGGLHSNYTKSNKCKIHLNENYKKICSKDYEILCDQCSLKHINSCSGNIINVDIAHRDFIHTLFLNVENLQIQKNMLRNDADTLQQVILQLNEVKQNAKKHAQSQFSDLISLLKVKEEQILRQIDNHVSQKQLQVQDYMKDVIGKIEQHTSLSDLMYAAINSDESYKFDLLGSLPFFTNKYKETLSFDQKKPISNYTQISELYIASQYTSGQVSPIEIYQLEEAKTLFSGLQLKGFKEDQNISQKQNMNLSQAINSSVTNLKSDCFKKNLLKSPIGNAQNGFGQYSIQNSNSNNTSQTTSQRDLSIPSVNINSSGQEKLPTATGVGGGLSQNQSSSSSSSLKQILASNSSATQQNNYNNINNISNTNNNNSNVSQSNMLNQNRLHTPKQTTRKTNSSVNPINKNNGSTSNLNANPLTNSIDFNSIVQAKCLSGLPTNPTSSILATALESEKQKSSAKKAMNSNLGSYNISQISNFCESVYSSTTGTSSVGINEQLSAKNSKQPMQTSSLLSSKISATPTDSNYTSTNSTKGTKVTAERTNKNISSTSSTRDQLPSSQRESSRSRVQQPSTVNQQNTPVKRSPSVTKKSVDPINSNRQSASRSSYTSSTTGNKVGAKSLHDITDILSNHDLIQYSELAKNPLTKRVITKAYSTCSSIMFQWTHSAYYQGDIKYAVQFGIGIKIGGKEQFKQVYFGSTPQYVIEGLQAKTTYRVRVCAVQTKKKEIQSLSSFTEQQALDNNQMNPKSENNLQEEETVTGEWSEIHSVCTQEIQTVEPSECAQVIRKEKEIIVQYDTPGIVATQYAYNYGKITWDITASVASHACGEDTTACLIVGVTNKQSKKYNIVGSTINYGLHRETLKIKVQLDFSKNIMVIYTPSQPLGEVYNSLPIGPLFPAFQNKTSQKTTLSNLKLRVAFEESSQNTN